MHGPLNVKLYRKSAGHCSQINPHNTVSLIGDAGYILTKTLASKLIEGGGCTISKYVVFNITLLYVLHVRVLQAGINFIFSFILSSLCYALK